jgi:hypothetical protein
MQSPLNKNESVNNFIFWLYIYFVIDFFLHLSERIPGYGVIRPTLVLVILLTIFLISQKDKFKGMGDDPVLKKIKWLIIYVIITLPLVTWPGSVLLNNIPVFVKAVVFFFFTALIIDTEKRLKIFLCVFITSQIFRVLEPLYMNITSGYWGDKTHLGHGEFASRLSGAPADVVNPNGLGFVIVTIVPYLYYLAWQSPSKLLKLFSLGVSPLLMYALVLTMSRGAFVALLVVLWMIFKDSRHKFFLIIVLIVSLVGVWSNLSDDHKDRYLSLVSSSAQQSGSVEGRWRGMINEFGVALERPLIGHGLGTSKEAKTHAGVGWLISHNLYIEVLIELGFVGFVIFFLFLKSIYNKYKENLAAIKLYHSSDESAFICRLNTAFNAVFWMYAVYSINYFGLSTYYWYLFAGLTIAFSRIYFIHTDESEKKERVNG